MTQSRNSRQLVIFDFDGVICDSFNLNLAVRDAMGAPVDPEGYVALFDGNIYEVLNALHGKEQSKAQNDVFFQKAEELKYHELPHFEGMEPMIRDLASRGYLLVIVSSTNDDLIEKNCKHRAVHHHFHDIMGRTSGESKVEKMQTLLAKYSLAPSDCVMVTDTLGDIREAARLGISAIGVLWGFHDRKRLERAGHVSHFAQNPAELHTVLLQHLAGTCGCAITSVEQK